MCLCLECIYILMVKNVYIQSNVKYILLCDSNLHLWFKRIRHIIASILKGKINVLWPWAWNSPWFKTNKNNSNYVPFQDRAFWVELLHHHSLQSLVTNGDKFQKELEVISLFETLKSISLEAKLWSHEDWLVQSKSQKGAQTA